MNFIFDFDGTLVDSYGPILRNLMLTNNHYGIDHSREFIFSSIIKLTITDYAQKTCRDYNIDYYDYDNYYRNLDPHLEEIVLMPEALGTLCSLKSKGHRLFMYTHRGKSLETVLNALKIKDFFEDIVDITFGFEKKPSGEGVSYLVKKYSLLPDDTYYVGDREIDVLCAKDAGVKCIFYESSGIGSVIQSDITIYSLKELLIL